MDGNLKNRKALRSPDYVFKVVINGDPEVGKTNILLRYISDIFREDSEPTIGVEFKSKKFEMKGQLINLQIWDTAGQERYRSLAKTYYRGSRAFILVYDITNKWSFKNLERWIKECKNNTDFDLVPLFILGNKKDLEDKRRVSFEEGWAFAKKHDSFFMEISAKDNHDCLIDKVFELMVEEMMEVQPKIDIIVEEKRLKDKMIKRLNLIDLNASSDSEEGVQNSRDPKYREKKRWNSIYSRKKKRKSKKGENVRSKCC